MKLEKWEFRCNLAKRASSGSTTDMHVMSGSLRCYSVIRRGSGRGVSRLFTTKKTPITAQLGKE